MSITASANESCSKGIEVDLSYDENFHTSKRGTGLKLIAQMLGCRDSYDAKANYSRIVSKNAIISAICRRFPMKDRNCETDSGIKAMTVAGKFTMTRIEILAVSLHAANHADDPYGSPAFQIRRLLGI